MAGHVAHREDDDDGELRLGAMLAGVLLLLQTSKRKNSADTVTTNSMAYSATSSAASNDGSDCSPCSRTGGAPAMITGVLVQRFQNRNFRKVQNKEGNRFSKDIEAIVMRVDGQNPRTSSMAAAAVDRSRPKIRAAWRPVFGEGRGKR